MEEKTHTYSDGSQYIGEYKDNLQHGQGTYTYANGDKYVGGWKDNTRNGWGTFTYSNGDKYVGEFKDGLRHGEGTLYIWNGTADFNAQSGGRFLDEDIVVGSWRDGGYLYFRMHR